MGTRGSPRGRSPQATAALADPAAAPRGRGLGHDNNVAAVFLPLLERSVGAGTKVFADGEAPDNFYFIVTGKLRISKHIPGIGEEALGIGHVESSPLTRSSYHARDAAARVRDHQADLRDQIGRAHV